MKILEWILGIFKRKQEITKPPTKVKPKRVRKKRRKKKRNKRPHKCAIVNKVRYKDKAKAVKQSERLASNTINNYLRVYKCEFCNDWHLTHHRRR